MKINKVGVIGAGQMGNGIAHVCALAGYDVVIEDINNEQLGKARGTIERNLARQAARGLISQSDADSALSRIRIAADVGAMKDRDLVIEAATEKEAIKREIFKRLIPNLKAEAIIATNTSSISITRLAASMTMSHSPKAVKSVAVRIWPSAVSFSSSLMRPRAT